MRTEFFAEVKLNHWYSMQSSIYKLSYSHLYLRSNLRWAVHEGWVWLSDWKTLNLHIIPLPLDKKQATGFSVFKLWKHFYLTSLLSYEHPAKISRIESGPNASSGRTNIINTSLHQVHYQTWTHLPCNHQAQETMQLSFCHLLTLNALYTIGELVQ